MSGWWLRATSWTRAISSASTPASLSFSCCSASSRWRCSSAASASRFSRSRWLMNFFACFYTPAMPSIILCASRFAWA